MLPESFQGHFNFDMTINFDMNEVFLNSELIKSGETRTTITANFPVTDIPTEEIHEIVDTTISWFKMTPKIPIPNSSITHTGLFAQWIVGSSS